MTIVAPAMTSAQAAAWHALLQVHERHPSGWALVGGQMVHSLCWERGAVPPRPTQDADAVLDRSETIDVEVSGRTGRVNRPTLQGALVAKASALLIGEGTRADRHLNDLAILASLVTRRDRVGERLTSTEVVRVRSALGLVLDRPPLHLSVGVDAATVTVVREQFVIGPH